MYPNNYSNTSQYLGKDSNMELNATYENLNL